MVETINKDQEHLKVLSIFHYIVGAIAAVFACLPLIHLAIGIIALISPESMADKAGKVPPPIFGWAFAIIGAALVVLGWTFVICLFYAGRFLARRRHYLFCLITAFWSCLFLPFGTILGIFTVIVLLRPSVKELFGVENQNRLKSASPPILVILIILMGAFVLSSCGKKEDSFSQGKAKTLSPVIKSIPAGSITIDGQSNDWEAAGIRSLEGLTWTITRFGETKDAEPQRIKSVWITHDGANLFLLLGIHPGIKESFEQTQRSGHIGYIFLDSDGQESTGVRRNFADQYAGWDYRIYLPTGFFGSSDKTQVKPLASYKVERIEEFILKEIKYGHSYHCEYEDVIGGDKSSHNAPNYISFQGNFLEMRFPFALLKMQAPTKIRLAIEELSGLYGPEVEIHAFLNE